MTGFGYNINGFGAGGVLPPYNADLLIVGGGGGGAPGAPVGRAGGGGGGGGFRTFTCQELAAGETYVITVGAGGAGGSPNASGGNSSIVGGGLCLVSNGGGRGGTAYEKLPPESIDDPCMDGASGGGGGGSNANVHIPLGGCGNSPPTNPSQGNNGGRGGGADCFIAGTQVMMHEEGNNAPQSFKNIEDVKVGDKVHRYDSKSNEVLELKNNMSTNGRKLVSINHSEYFFTEDHPLKTTDGWKSVNSKMSNQNYKGTFKISPYTMNIGEVGQLQIGDTIIGHNGNNTVVTAIATKEVPDNTPIYNFALDGDHEYFANGFLVHNKGGGGGGGGGAGAVGSNGAGNGPGGSGGAGSANDYSTGSPVTYAAGRPGGPFSGSGAGTAGTANLGQGGGGGGATSGAGAAGGSGFVVIRYDTSQAGAAGASGGNSTNTYCSGCVSYKSHRFTSSGCYTA
jgi:hypothetical protein